MRKFSLFSWQILFLYVLCGAFAARFFVPAFFAFSCIFLLANLSTVRRFFISPFICFFLGYLYISFSLPILPQPPTDFYDFRFHESTELSVTSKHENLSLKISPNSFPSIEQSSFLKKSLFPETSIWPVGVVEKNKFIITATVKKVRVLAESRQQIILEKVTVEKLVSKKESSKKESSKKESSKKESVEKVKIEDEKLRKDTLSGDLLLSAYDIAEVFAGQEISFEGRLYPLRGFQNDAGWNYDFYWQSKGVFWSSSLYKSEKLKSISGAGIEHVKFRQKIHEKIRELLPKTDGAGLLYVFLTGNKSFISPEIQELFQKSGLSHSLALSGLHLGLVFALGILPCYFIAFFRPEIFQKISRLQLSLFFSVPLVIFFLWNTGISPSLLRASSMLFFWIFMLLVLKRDNVFLDGLFYAALFIFLFYPLLIFDVALQLSIIATAGIIFYMPVSYRLFKKCNSVVSTLFLLPLSISVIANIVLFPLIISYFGIYAPNFLWNVFWVPFLAFFIIPFALLGYFFLLLNFSILTQWLFNLLSASIDIFLNLLRFSEQYGFLPEYLFFRFNSVQILMWYILCILPLLSLSFKKKSIIVSICILFFLFPFYSASRNSNSVQLAVLDVGQGESLFLETADGKKWIFDGGRMWNSSFDIGKAVLSANVTKESFPKVEGVIMSHADADHIGGIPYILEKHGAKKLYTNADTITGDIGKRIATAIHNENIVVQSLKAGDTIILGKDIYAKVLGPTETALSKKDRNSRSLILLVFWKERELFLFTGDSGKKELDIVSENDEIKNTDVLMLAHHGSASNYSPKLYKSLSPKIVSASCGYLPHFNFPAKKIQKYFKERDIHLLTTGANGSYKIVWQEK